MASIAAIVLAVMSTTSAAAPQCHLKPGVVVGTGSFKTTSEADATACCRTCFATQGCLAFTFDTSGTKDCFLKDNVFNSTTQV